MFMLLHWYCHKGFGCVKMVTFTLKIFNIFDDVYTRDGIITLCQPDASAQVVMSHNHGTQVLDPFRSHPPWSPNDMIDCTLIWLSVSWSDSVSHWLYSDLTQSRWLYTNLTQCLIDCTLIWLRVSLIVHWSDSVSHWLYTDLTQSRWLYTNLTQCLIDCTVIWLSLVDYTLIWLSVSLIVHWSDSVSLIIH